MLTPRTAIIVALVLWLTSVLLSIGAALTPDDSGGRGVDSFGTRFAGQRGMLETLQKLGIPAERQFDPPGDELATDVTFVLFAPNRIMMGFEPTPMQSLRTWVSRGGRLVVLSPDLFDDAAEIEQIQEQLEHFDADLFRLLEIDGISIEPLTHRATPTTQLPGRPGVAVVEIAPPWPTQDTPRQLAFPVPDLFVLEIDPQSTARVHTAIIDERNQSHPIAATVPVGAGEIVIVSDARLLENLPLGAADNAVWGVDLLTDGGRRAVVFDEFYHGLLVRGNNWWLLTKGVYLFPFLAILLVLGVVTWRAGTMLGPALSTQEPGRRVISEYVEAMGAMFLKARDGRRFVLQSVHDGQWRRLCHEFHLPPATTDIETIAQTIARRDPDRAVRVRASFATSRTLLKRRSIPESDCLKLLVELDRCC